MGKTIASLSCVFWHRPLPLPTTIVVLHVGSFGAHRMGDDSSDRPLVASFLGPRDHHEALSDFVWHCMAMYGLLLGRRPSTLGGRPSPVGWRPSHLGPPTRPAEACKLPPSAHLKVATQDRYHERCGTAAVVAHAAHDGVAAPGVLKASGTHRERVHGLQGSNSTAKGCDFYLS